MLLLLARNDNFTRDACQGLSSIAMLTALSKMMVQQRYSHCQLVVGMDANCYFDDKNGARLDMQDLGEWLADHGWQSCFGTTPPTPSRSRK